MNARGDARFAGGVALVAVVWPDVAEAHFVTSGLGPIYDGISHVLVSPEDLIAVLATGLVAGLNGPKASRNALFALTAGWLSGGLWGYTMAQPLVSFMGTSVSLLMLGMLIALDRRVSPVAVSVLATFVGLLHGWFNGGGVASEGREALGFVGIGVVVFVLTAISAAGVISLRPPWSRIAVRVAGSWIAATGLLMLGWALREL